MIAHHPHRPNREQHGKGLGCALGDAIFLPYSQQVRIRQLLGEDGIRRDKITTTFVGFRFEMAGTWSVDMRFGVRDQSSNFEQANTDDFFILNGLRRRF